MSTVQYKSKFFSLSMMTTILRYSLIESSNFFAKMQFGADLKNILYVRLIWNLMQINEITKLSLLQIYVFFGKSCR